MFGTLNEDLIINTVKKIGNGKIFNIGYRSEVPIKYEYKKQGLRITKFTEKCVRSGVNYSKIKEVILKLSNKEYPKYKSELNNYTWIVKNKVKYNSNTNKKYLYFATLNKGSNTHTRYIIDWPSKGIFVTATDIKDSPYRNCILNSYINKKDITIPVVQNISFENIYKINNIEC